MPQPKSGGLAHTGRVRTLALRRLRLLSLPPGSGVSPRKKLAFLAQLASLGYRLDDAELLDGSDDALFDDRSVLDTLRALRGGDADYVPLFLDFPDDIPDDDELFARRIVGYVGNALGAFDEGRRLDNGFVVPEWLFDVERYGADPITQFQTAGQFEAAKKRLAGREGDTHVEWIRLRAIREDDVERHLADFLLGNLYAKASIKQALHEDLATLLARYGAAVDPAKITMKENLALVMRLFWSAGEHDRAAALAQTPTDLLRLFAALTESDVSLATKIKFPKLTRTQRRTIVRRLAEMGSIEEDLWRYRGLWKALGKSIHVGEYASEHPTVASAFHRIRNGHFTTFDAHTEYFLRARETDRLLAHLAKRPGVLGRRVHELLRKLPDATPAILDAFDTLLPDITLKNALVLEAYFATIDDLERRTVINKRGRVKVVPNNAHHALPPATLATLRDCIGRALRSKVAAKGSWSGRSVWIDPKLCQYTVPLQQRAASDGLLTYGRGSQIDVDLGKVLRLFVYWKQTAHRTDLDLSTIQFDDAFNYIGHVSYTNLAAAGIRHSGDVQSAPHGAAEFIDISIAALARRVRYVVPQVYKYAGEHFGDMTCHAGWMIRDRVDVSRDTFDIKTVQNKFDLTGRNSFCLPFALDVKTGRATLFDLYVGTKTMQNRVESSASDIELIGRELLRFVDTRPTMLRLAELHRDARDAATALRREDADITFGLADTTYDAGRADRVLSELL